MAAYVNSVHFAHNNDPFISAIYIYRVLEDMHILLHGTNEHSTEYTTKLFEKINSSPFWVETQTQTLRCNIKTAIVVVIDLEELKSNVVSKIEFNGVIFYRFMGKECLLPIDDVKLSSLDTMAEEFDVISSVPIGEYFFRFFDCRSFASCHFACSNVAGAFC